MPAALWGRSSRAAALLTRPRSAPVTNRHNVDVEGSAWSPRNAAVTGSASNARSDRKVPIGQQRLDQRPVALPAGVPARPDRPQPPPVSLGDHVQPVQQRPQHHEDAVRSSCQAPTFGVGTGRSGRARRRSSTGNGSITIVADGPRFAVLRDHFVPHSLPQFSQMSHPPPGPALPFPSLTCPLERPRRAGAHKLGEDDELSTALRF